MASGGDARGCGACLAALPHEMKITAEPKRVDDLLRFLRDGGYDAREGGFGTVEIDLFDEGRRLARLESELRMWSAVNRAEVRIVTSGGSRGLQAAEPAEGDAGKRLPDPLPAVSPRKEPSLVTSGGSPRLQAVEPTEVHARTRVPDPIPAISPGTGCERLRRFSRCPPD